MSMRKGELSEASGKASAMSEDVHVKSLSALFSS